MKTIIEDLIAKNLRIGNFVRAKSPKKKSWVMAHKISAHTLFSMEYPTAMDFVKPDIEPIPLTKEWLLQLGFFEKDDCAGWHKEGLVYYEGFICDSQRNKIKYVHELQNIFFALTGIELELKNLCKS